MLTSHSFIHTYIHGWMDGWMVKHQMERIEGIDTYPSCLTAYPGRWRSFMPSLTRLSQFFVPTLLNDHLPRAVCDPSVPKSYKLLIQGGLIKSVNFVADFCSRPMGFTRSFHLVRK